MRLLLRGHDRLCLALVHLFHRLALAVDDHRRRLPREVGPWRGAIRRLYSRWLDRHGLAPLPTWPRRRRPWNRTPDHLEEKVVRLHVEQPLLGSGQLRFIARRVLGFEAARVPLDQRPDRRDRPHGGWEGHRTRSSSAGRCSYGPSATPSTSTAPRSGTSRR